MVSVAMTHALDSSNLPSEWSNQSVHSFTCIDVTKGVCVASRRARAQAWLPCLRVDDAADGSRQDSLRAFFGRDGEHDVAAGRGAIGHGVVPQRPARSRALQNRRATVAIIVAPVDTKPVVPARHDAMRPPPT